MQADAQTSGSEEATDAEELTRRVTDVVELE